MTEYQRHTCAATQAPCRLPRMLRRRAAGGVAWGPRRAGSPAGALAARCNAWTHARDSCFFTVGELGSCRPAATRHQLRAVAGVHGEGRQRRARLGEGHASRLVARQHVRGRPVQRPEGRRERGRRGYVHRHHKAQQLPPAGAPALRLRLACVRSGCCVGRRPGRPLLMRAGWERTGACVCSRTRVAAESQRAGERDSGAGHTCAGRGGVREGARARSCPRT